MNIKQIAQFVSAGKAEFILINKNADEFRYKVSRADDVSKTWFVSVMVRVGYQQDYGYIGMIRKGEFIHTSSSFVDEEDERFDLFDWFFLQLVRQHELPEAVEFIHLGRCGRCGRELIDSKSISIGLGPVCRGYQ
jgi:hypothetical protein